MFTNRRNRILPKLIVSGSPTSDFNKIQNRSEPMMRSSTSSQGNPEIKRVVDSLLLSATNFDRYENRSAIREPLVVPVRIELSGRNLQMPGFTRNISTTGVGLLLPAPCVKGDQALITLERADGGGKHSILAECRWCKAYGESWTFSGWQFIKVQR